jgi:hypothetical protein
VTTFQIEFFAESSSTRAGRTLRCSRDRALDQLAGRTIWCDVEIPVFTTTRRLELPGDAPLAELAARPDVALAEVDRDDIVLLDDALTALMAEAVRERGAHTVWLLGRPATRRRTRARSFMRPSASAVDAYVTSWRDAVAALIPSSDRVTVKAGPDAELDWNCALAEVVAGDRHDTVGGTFHVRPAVAPR